MSAPETSPLTDEEAQAVALELCELAALGASDAVIVSRLLGPVMDEHGSQSTEAVIGVLVRALAGLLQLGP